MKMFRDNTAYKKEIFQKKYKNLSGIILDRRLDVLSSRKNLFIYPNDIVDNKKLKNDSMIVQSYGNNQIRFQNIVGFIGCGKEKLNIHSRFSNGSSDYFLHYMLQKVFDINVVDLDTGLSTEETMYRLLHYAFPMYLQEALKKGIFKQYKRVEHNDINIKGSIDISRHIKLNTPFMGKVAYSTRELTSDNDLMQLIRHTIEYIGSLKSGNQILNSSDDIRQYVAKVVGATPSYNIHDRQKIILKNKMNPVQHVYYTEYKDLQNLCLKILEKDRHGLGGRTNTIRGILFDVSWIWEEYINTILKNKDIIHTHNGNAILDKGTKPVYVFTDNVRQLPKGTVMKRLRRRVFPDFFTREGKLILDTKYKLALDDNTGGIDREDIFQMVTYIHILNAKSATLVYPSKTGNSGFTLDMPIEGLGGKILKLGLAIPQESKDYRQFIVEMKKSELDFKNQIEELLKNKLS